jgi:hypothetical protein
MQGYMRQIEVLTKEGRVEVVSACDVREERGAFVRETYGVDRFSTRSEDVIQSDDVDLVLVLTSMPAHGSLTRAALEAGKHVHDTAGRDLPGESGSTRRVADACSTWVFTTLSRSQDGSDPYNG